MAERDPAKSDRSTRIGPYRLTALIGQGGMGSVYAANQEEPLPRKVAIKLIRTQHAGDDVVARFNTERHVLALMDHPNIAQVFDAGTTEAGLPYFVMEFVDGKPVDQFADEACLTIEQRLELFLSICHGVHHAHQKGIIHRDIKAANVLVRVVDGQFQPKIIDFGIAKAIGPNRQPNAHETQVEQLVGTPEYMSPEQAMFANQDLDIRTDVYSLGVMLQLLLVGSLPYYRKTEGPLSDYELLFRITSEDPEPLSITKNHTRYEAQALAIMRSSDVRKLRRALQGDLQWIVAKCLQKERDNRYGSVNELAGDIRRYLRCEPVDAHPPSPMDRLRKFARRHRIAVIAGGSVAIALILGIVGTSIGMVRALNAEDRLRQQAKLAEEARAQASVQRNLALKTLDSLVGEVDTQLSRRPDLDQLRISLLDLAVDGLDELTSISGPDLDIAKNRVIAHQSVARIYLTARKLEQAKQSLDEAIRVSRELYKQFPQDPEIRLLMADSYLHAARISHNWRMGDIRQSRDLLRQALSTIQIQDPEPLRQQVVRKRCEIYRELGDVLYDLEAFEEADRAYGEGLAATRELDGQDVEHAYLHAELLSGRGDVAFATGHVDDAHGHYTQSLALLEDLATRHDDLPKTRRHLALAQFSLGDVARKNEHFDEALTRYRAAWTIQRELLELDPFHPQWRRDLLATIYRMGDLSRDQDLPSQAIGFYRDAVNIAQALLERNPANAEAHRDLLVCHLRIGDIRLAQRRLQSAREAFENCHRQAQWLVRHTPQNAGAHTDLILSIHRLASADFADGKIQDAMTGFERSLHMLNELKQQGVIKDDGIYAPWFDDITARIDQCRTALHRP